MAEQTFQVGIKALIRNKDGEILMVHVPKWGHNPEHWDLPGGRMDSGETFFETLKRELEEEIGVNSLNNVDHLMTILTNITIPVGQEFIPLIYIIYKVEVEDIKEIKLADDTREDKLAWLPPRKAAKLMAVKFSPDFCKLVDSM